MNILRVSRIAVQLLTLVVTTISGAYLLIYLYRWEWNRAVISGIFALIALLVFEMAVVFGALRSIGERLDRIDGSLERAASTRNVAQEISEHNAGDRGQHFEWLRETGDRFTVFVPLLIGAGAVLSGVAYVVERVAGLFASATLDRKTARLLAPELPLGSGLITGSGRTDAGHRKSTPPIARILGWSISVSIVCLLAVAGINLLADASESRPEALDAQRTTVVDLSIDQKRTQRSDATVAEAFWIACRNTVPPEAQLVGTAEITGGARLTIDRGLGELRRRRLFGCIEDATLDLVRASVTSFEIQPKP
jgi:hypothetical protein